MARIAATDAGRERGRSRHASLAAGPAPWLIARMYADLVTSSNNKARFDERRRKIVERKAMEKPGRCR